MPQSVRRVLMLLAATASFLAAPAAAHADGDGFTYVVDSGPASMTVVVDTSDAEPTVNHWIEVTPTDSTHWDVHELGAFATIPPAGTDCVAGIDATHITCTTPSAVTNVEIRTGSGDDIIRLATTTGLSNPAGTANVSLLAMGGLGVDTIGQDGAGIVASGGNAVAIPPAAGGPATFGYAPGNGIVASGGGNIVASGGGNIVASGGGNIISSNGSAIVASGGGNIIGAAGALIAAAIVASGGGN